MQHLIERITSGQASCVANGALWCTSAERYIAGMGWSFRGERIPFCMQSNASLGTMKQCVQLRDSLGSEKQL